MNIKYHLFIGISGAIIAKDWYFLVGSVISDLPLIHNELKIIYKKQKFSLPELNMIELGSYRATHSLFILPFLLFFNIPFVVAILLHQIFDWFTHTGQMSAQPFYPFRYKVKFGKDIMK